MNPPHSADEWSHEYQRWLRTRWHADYRRWYRTHYVEREGWVFFDWSPATLPAQTPHDTGRPRVDSAIYAPHSNAKTIVGANEPIEGLLVRGSYNPANPQPNSHYELLDRSFYVRSRAFFTPGKVFAVLFSETAGITVTNYNTSHSTITQNDAFSRVKYGETAHTQIRRFIVVSQRVEFCYAIPIFTYGNQATLKPGVRAREHAIAYSSGYTPVSLPGENGMDKLPICVDMAPQERHLSTTSRIYFGVHHPIQFNVKVKEIGHVQNKDIVRLLGYWNMEHRQGTEQDTDVAYQNTGYDDQAGPGAYGGSGSGWK